MKKNNLFVTLSLIFIATAYTSAGNPECFTVSYEYNKKTYKNTKTILKKGKKTIAQYAANYTFVMQLTNESAYFASDDRTTDVIIGCDGKIMQDSISQVSLLINTEGSGGDRTEQRVGYIVTKNEQKMFYDMSDKAMKNAVFDDVKLGPYTQPNQRPDLLPNVPKLILLYVAKNIDAKTKVWGVYDLATQQLLMQPRYQLAEGTTANNFYFAQWGFAQFINPQTNKAQLYNFYDTPVANTQGRIWIYETNMLRSGTPYNKMVLDVDGKFFREDGSPIAFPKYDDISRCGFYAQLIVNKKMGLYDFEGREIIPIQFDELSEEYCRSYQDLERYMAVKQDKMWGYYDTKAKKMATAFDFKRAFPVSKGVSKMIDKNDVEIYGSFEMDEAQLAQRSAAMEADFREIDKLATATIKELKVAQHDLVVKIENAQLSKDGMLAALDKLKDDAAYKKKPIRALIDKYEQKWGSSISSQDKIYFQNVYEGFSTLNESIRKTVKMVNAAK